MDRIWWAYFSPFILLSLALISVGCYTYVHCWATHFFVSVTECRVPKGRPGGLSYPCMLSRKKNAIILLVVDNLLLNKSKPFSKELKTGHVQVTTSLMPKYASKPSLTRYILEMFVSFQWTWGKSNRPGCRYVSSNKQLQNIVDIFDIMIYSFIFFYLLK